MPMLFLEAFPSNTIVLWSGSIADIPDGWTLCDGTQDTPDLRDRFVIGAGSTHNPDDVGGEADHTLTIAEMPSHTHLEDGEAMVGGLAASGFGVSVFRFTPKQTGSTGGDGAHENRPPFYALAYIMKV